VNDQSLVPGRNPRLGSISYAEWLAQDAPKDSTQRERPMVSTPFASMARMSALLLCTLVVTALSLLRVTADNSPAHDSKGRGRTESKEAIVTSLFSKDLADLPGKEGLMIMVEYPPGSVDPIHRHNAHAFIYLLEGSIIMQLRGGKEVTLTPGETFYEGPDDVHVIGRNASQTKPAKFVVVFLKDKGAAVLEHAR
jgi:quercetin dioxygenase-like cupin family protein